MVFSSFSFISVFLPLVLAAYFLLPKKIRNLVLVIASLAFYTWGEARTSLALIVLLTTVNFYLGKLIGEAQRERRKRLIVLAVALNLGVLIVFKYAAFVLMNLNVAESGVDDKFRMVVPVYLELDDGRIVFLGRMRIVGNKSEAAKVPLKGLKAKPRRAMINYYDDVLASPG